MNKRITYFLHAPVGFENDKFYIKDILNNYFEELCNYATITLFGVFQNKKYFHNTELTPRIENKLIDSKQNKIYFIKIIKMFRVIKNSDLCFLFMPCLSSVLAGLLCIILKKPFVTYFGANWHDLEISKKHKNIFKAKLYQKLSNLLCTRSIFSLHTGNNIKNNHKGVNKIITAPIINISTSECNIASNIKNLSNAHDIKLLYVGSLTQNKGIDILLKAISKLKDSRLLLHIIGEGPEHQSLERLSSRLGISDRIVFHGFMKNGPELFKFYKGCDIFILPSFSEGFPRVLYEAAANWCPIITTSVNSIPDLFKDNYNCLFIKPGDDMDIVIAINRMISEKGLNTYLTKNAYHIVNSVLQETAATQHFRLINQFI